MCGSHGLRAKGPFLYQEIMHIPLIVRAPGRIAGGTVTHELTSSVDVPTTITRLAGIEQTPSMSGVDLQPLFDDPSASVRDHVLFALDSPWFPSVRATRYASRGIFDGRYKYGRYYGVGGGVCATGEVDAGPKTFDVDSRFEDHDHELYDLQEDPGELVNLANDRGRRDQLRAMFERLLEAEAESFGPLQS
jgi:arylsulfatase A-like enzyme